jgi:DNA-binding transcriptional LysR family regulator
MFVFRIDLDTDRPRHDDCSLRRFNCGWPTSETENVITLHQLKLFVSVAKSLNMTATSHEFHVSQSAVSHQIKKLERELGKTLLRRNNRPVALTAAGLALLRECEFILSKIDDLFRHDVNVAPSRRKRKPLRSAPFSRRLGR